MPIDLNALPLEPVGEVDANWDGYKEPTDFPPPVQEADYKLKQLKIEVSGFNKDTGTVTCEADWEVRDKNDPSVVLGKIMFDRIKTNWFGKQKDRNEAVDHLRAFGITDRPAGPRDWGALLTSTQSLADQGELIDAHVTWRGWCSHKGTDHETIWDKPEKTPGRKPVSPQPQGHKDPVELKGSSKWPQIGTNGTKERASEVPCPVCSQPIRARAEVGRKIPRSN